MSNYVPHLAAALVALSVSTAQASVAPPCKNECLLSGTQCPGGNYSLPERIEKLKAALGSNDGCYSEDELKTLKKKLQDDLETMKNLRKPGRR